MSPQRAFALLATTIALGLLLPELVQRGMFMDGLLYTVVAHNQAHGIGTFWEPRFSELGFAGITNFHEHPPLVFGIQALWFSLWGDAFWVERAYCLLTAVLGAALIMGLWRSLVEHGRPERSLAWWPVLLWIIMPPVHWSLRNNMQENTMTLFCLAAVWSAVHGMRRPGWSAWPFAVAGISTLAAILSKGPPGAYPLVAPLAWALAMHKGVTKRAVGGSLVMGAALLVSLGLLLAWPDARTSLLTYAEQRLLHRLDDAPTVDHRWRILQHLVNALLGPLALAMLVRWTGLGQGTGQFLLRPSLVMAAIGLGGVLPLMLTMVQKSFYMVQGLPLLALALGLGSASHLDRLLDRFPPGGRLVRWISTSAFVGLAAVLAATAWLWNKPGRDVDMLHDVAIIGTVVPPHSTMGADPALWPLWNLQSYLLRDHFISIDPNGADREWYLGSPSSGPPRPGAREMDLGLLSLRLWNALPPSADEAP